MASTAEDQARLLVTIEATQRKFEKQMATIAKSAGDTAGKIERGFQRANDNTARSFNTSGQAAVRSMNAQRAAAQNLSFQLNDIATQLASGTSPWRVLAQQIGQVTQALQQAGGGGGAVRALGAAFGQLLNPVGLATLAIGTLSAAAISYFMEWSSGGEESSEGIKKQAQLIQQVADKWGDALPSLRAYADELQRMAESADRAAAAQQLLQKIYEKPTQQLELSVPDYFDAIAKLGNSGVDIGPLQQAFTDLEAKLRDNKATAEDVRAVYDQLISYYNSTGIESVGSLAGKFKELEGKVAEAAAAAAKARTEFDALEAGIGRLEGILGIMTNNFAGLGEAGVAAATDIANAMAGSLGPAIQGVVGDIANMMNNLQQLQGMVNQTKLNALTPLVSGGGKFMNPDEFQTFKANNTKSQTQIAAEKEAAASARELASANREAAAEQKRIGRSLSADVLKKFEGFSSKPYYDVNAYRAGYGSDTVTLSDGSVQKVTAGMRVSMEQATADLARRIGDFQSGIRGQIGGSTFDNMNEQQQAALTSIAYNYGSLPERIVAAIKTGSDQMVVQAIQNLGGDNNGVNRSRRNAEAQLYGGVPVENIEALGGVYMGVGGKIDGASAATQRFMDAQQQAAAMSQEIGSTIAGAFSGFIQDIIAGKDASEALANALAKVGQKLLDIALNQIFSGLFGGGGGGGGILGGLFGGGGGAALGVGLYHKGGVVGRGSSGNRRVSPSLFHGAPRYHSGGVAGLKPGELPAILQRGEVVIPRGGVGGREGSAHTNIGSINIRVDDQGKAMDTGQKTALSREMVAAVEQVIVRNQRAGGLLANTNANQRR